MSRDAVVVAVDGRRGPGSPRYQGGLAHRLGLASWTPGRCIAWRPWRCCGRVDLDDASAIAAASDVQLALSHDPDVNRAFLGPKMFRWKFAATR